ncbi:hypothetical protein FG475_15390 [Vibrio navarrensis]|uniref:hypothetical protein n=1 Tax=Vibrio navarrensis TaxID=29495 RepID=UPI0018DD2503|nr:hypothetical protein [Vibrio navarrensis]EHA1126504.1 hypothetical protein [Vibrio navarrensis]MBH9740071.1 hypothetical protein [Vibrio navarrensis]
MSQPTIEFDLQFLEWLSSLERTKLVHYNCFNVDAVIDVQQDVRLLYFNQSDALCVSRRTNWQLIKASLDQLLSFFSTEIRFRLRKSFGVHRSRTMNQLKNVAIAAKVHDWLDSAKSTTHAESLSSVIYLLTAFADENKELWSDFISSVPLE